MTEPTVSASTASDQTEFVLGPTRYGKAEVRLVHVARNGAEHAIRDLNVSVALSGDQADTHLTGDNTKVLTTDAQKNAVYALARQHGVDAVEDFAKLLARHFLTTCPYISHARVAIDEYAWDRIPGVQSRHSFVRSGREVRTVLVHADAAGASSVVSGLKDLVVLNSTGSEFHGFFHDEYTTLAETTDRVLATAVDARWRHLDHTLDHTGECDWDKSYAQARAALLTAFADTHSLSLQQTLYAMARRLIGRDEQIAEVRLALPNRHHFTVDLAPFGLTNENEVFYAADRPYGLIEGTVARAGTPPDPAAWD
jgi:urate oxidase